jgi:tetratricopeptide (TPR) repeat protein
MKSKFRIKKCSLPIWLLFAVVLIEVPGGLAPISIAQSKGAAELNNDGILKMKSGDYKNACLDFEEAIRQSPYEAQYYRSLAEAKLKLGDTKAAVSNFNNEGLIDYSKDDYKGAIACYTEAIRIDSNCVFAFHNRGLAKQKLGDAIGARADFQEEQSLRAHPR